MILGLPLIFTSPTKVFHFPIKYSLEGYFRPARSLSISSFRIGSKHTQHIHQNLQALRLQNTMFSMELPTKLDGCHSSAAKRQVGDMM